MNYTDKQILETAPFVYFQIRMAGKPSSDTNTFEILYANKAFEKLAGLKRTRFINQKFEGIPLELKHLELEKIFDFFKTGYNKGLQTFDFLSGITNSLNKIQMWSTENNSFHCILSPEVERNQADEGKNILSEESEYKPITNQFSGPHPNVHNSLTGQENQKDEKALILDAISEMILYHDTDMKLVWANTSVLEKIGKPLQEVINNPCYKTFFQKDEQCQDCPVNKTLETGERFSLIQERPDGQIWEIQSTPIFLEQGILTGVVETIKDVTQTKHSEAEIKRNEEKYRRLTEKTEVIIWEYDFRLDKWTHVSPQVKKILGYHPEEWTNYKFWYQNIHSEDREWATKYCSELTQKGINHVFEYRFRKKDGSYIWVSDDVNVELRDAKPDKMWGSLRDITQQKISEHALRESKEKLAITLKSIGDGVIATDINGNIESMNPAAESMCAWDLKDAMGKPLNAVFHIINADTRKTVANPVKKVLETGKIIGLANHTVLISQNGVERQIADSAAPIRNKEGKIEGAVLVFSDVTENYTKQIKILESEEKFRLLITQMEQGIAVHEAIYNNKGEIIDYRFLDVNRSFEKLTGLERKNILGKTILEVLPDIEPSWIHKYASVVKTGNPIKFEDYSRELGKYFEVLAYRTRKQQFAVMFADITERKRFEEKIKTSDKIFNHSIDMLCIAGFDGYFKVLNPSWSRVLGWSEEELLSKPWLEFVHPEDRVKTRNIKSKLVNGIEVYQFENRYICKDNTIKWLSWNSFPYPEESIMFGVARDITLQKQADSFLRENEEKFRLLFENSPLGILHFDQDGYVVSSNDQLINILESSKELLTGINLLNQPDQNMVKIAKKVLEGKNVTHEIEYTNIRGSKTTPIRIIASPILADDKTIKGGMALIEDLTDHIQKRDLQKKVAVAEESVKFKQNFLANMSHEIRTPLTGILGITEILEQTTLTPVQLDYLKTLKLSGENLREIINLILDFSKIEAGKVQLKKKSFEFKNLFVHTQTLFHSICNKPIVFQTDIDSAIPKYIYADENRILQIINNLISNAVKFTEEGKISIEAKLVNADAEHLKIQISVSDTGMGIPLEKQKQLFSPFTQVDESSSRSMEGTGLGLAICKELVKLLGGKMCMKSKYGEGSTFWFTFLARESEHVTENRKKEFNAPGSSPKTLRILLAEDKIVNQKVFRIMLTSLGHEVTVANNGLEFLKVYKPGLFDIIFMDIQMPEMDGLAAVKKIREQYKELPPIVGLSANAFEGDREKYMALGMDEYLTKPLKKNDFLRMLKVFFANE